jgi:hypothetical protein
VVALETLDAVRGLELEKPQGDIPQPLMEIVPLKVVASLDEDISCGRCDGKHVSR